jgi:hypothetical protein
MGLQSSTEYSNLPVFIKLWQKLAGIAVVPIFIQRKAKWYNSSKVKDQLKRDNAAMVLNAKSMPTNPMPSID